MILILIFIIAYLIGSISGSLIVSLTLFREDIRDKGSGNAGTTNTFRVYGKKYAVIAFIIDLLKAILAIYLASFIDANYGIYISGSAVVIGHCWPIFHKFKGGKGVATSFGVNLYLAIVPAIFQFFVFSIINLTVGLVSLASILAVIVALIVVLIFYKDNMPLIIMTLVNTIVVIIRHKDNIIRLIKGKESRTNLIKSIIAKNKE